MTELPWGDHTLFVSPGCTEQKLLVGGEVHRVVANELGNPSVYVREVDGVVRSVDFFSDVDIDWADGSVWCAGGFLGWVAASDVQAAVG